MDNSTIRNQMKLKRNLLSNEEVISLSDKITDKVLSVNLINYTNFFIYKSFNGEVDTKRLIEYFLGKNKVVAYPVIVGEDMVAGIPNGKGVKFSKFKTEEPSEYVEMKGVDVCFVPLLAFDNNKNRLGYGKGYYDRFLSAHPCLKIGLAYDFQLTENINVTTLDVPLDIIVTESKIIK